MHGPLATKKNLFVQPEADKQRQTDRPHFPAFSPSLIEGRERTRDTGRERARERESEKEQAREREATRIRRQEMKRDKGEENWEREGWRRPCMFTFPDTSSNMSAY